MIKEPTCLILGAGASAPYGLPTTNQLRDLILCGKGPDGPATAAKFPLQQPRFPTKPEREWQTYLSRVADAAGLTPLVDNFWNTFFKADQSIDWFIRDNESTFGHIARLHIAAVLLNCERADKLNGNWYRSLSKILLPTRAFDVIAERKLSIISFNYDRSFERYFLNVLESQYALSSSEAKAVFDRIELVHVYGQLGSLDEVSYGDISRALAAAKGIRLIRAEKDKDIQAKVGALIRRSTYINFIGFGFDDENIELLGPSNFVDVTRVYATTYGLGWTELNKAVTQLRVYFDDPKNPPNWTAEQLFKAKDLFGPKVHSRQLAQEAYNETKTKK